MPHRTQLCPLLETRVTITGTSREDLNGTCGWAASYDHEVARYVVNLDGGTLSLKLKPGNLVAEGEA